MLFHTCSGFIDHGLDGDAFPRPEHFALSLFSIRGDKGVFVKFCAYAMADGKKVKIDPEAWAIEDGKLYLNYNQKIQDKWMEKMNEFITKADKEWYELMEQ